MRKIFFIILTLACLWPLCLKAADVSDVVLSPYVFNNSNTPKANKILEDKLKRIVTQYGLYSENDLNVTPFILTANAIESRNETTATVPPRTAVELSITFYVGNGEDGTLFSSCNMDVNGVGNSLDQAYASAFKRINVNDPNIQETINQGKEKIIKYYEESSGAIIKKAEALAAKGNYDEAYGLLLQVPSVCSNYETAQSLVTKYVQKENDNFNGDIIRQARSAWSADPTEAGASKAVQILGQMNNASSTKQSEADALLKEISTRLQNVQDKELEAEKQRESHEHKLAMQREANEHARQIQVIKGNTKVAVARAKRPIYRIWWW